MLVLPYIRPGVCFSLELLLPFIRAGVAELVLPFITAGVAFHHSWCCLVSELVLPLICAGVAFHQSWCCLSPSWSNTVMHHDAPLCIVQACQACQQHALLCSGQHQIAIKKQQVSSKAKLTSVLHFRASWMLYASC